MTTTPVSNRSHPMSIDVSGTPAVPMTRLVGVEVRKVVDTRAGRWVAGSILALVLVVMVIFAFAGSSEQTNFHNFLNGAAGGLGYFLPILIIMSVTSEASQRNGLITFTLEPRRSRVVIAKLVAGVLLAVGMMILAALLAAVVTLGVAVAGGSPSWSVSADQLIFALVISQLIGVFVGFALAMLIMNTPGAIVAYFAYTFLVPVAVGILSALSSGFKSAAPWIDFNTAQTPLISGDYSPSGEEWAQLLVTGVIWLVIPLALGIWRLLRIEFK